MKKYAASKVAVAVIGKKVLDSLLILSEYKNEKEVKPRYNELIENGIELYKKANDKEQKLQRIKD